MKKMLLFMLLCTFMVAVSHAKDGVVKKKHLTHTNKATPEKMSLKHSAVQKDQVQAKENSIQKPFDCSQTYTGYLSCGQAFSITVSMYAIMPASECQQATYEQAYWIYMALESIYCENMCAPPQN